MGQGEGICVLWVSGSREEVGHSKTVIPNSQRPSSSRRSGLSCRESRLRRCLTGHHVMDSIPGSKAEWKEIVRRKNQGWGRGLNPIRSYFGGSQQQVGLSSQGIFGKDQGTLGCNNDWGVCAWGFLLASGAKN